MFYLGNYRDHVNDIQPFYAERVSSALVGIGEGKKETIDRLVLEDIFSARSCGYITSDIEPVLSRIPEERQKDIIIFSPGKTPFGFNVLDTKGKHELVASIITKACTKERITEFREYTFRTYFRYAIQTLLAVPSTSLLHAKKLLTDSEYRNSLEIDDPFLKQFWNDFDALRDKELYTESSLALLYDLMASPSMRECLGQSKNSLHGKHILVELDEKLLGRDNVKLLGNLVLAMFYVEGLNQSDMTVYIDDAARFTMVPDVAGILPTVVTLRKVHEEILDAVQQVVALRTTGRDARVLEPEFYLATGEHLYGLGDFQAFFPRDFKAIKLDLLDVNYKKTFQGKKIRRRCISQCSQPLDVLERRLGRLCA